VHSKHLHRCCRLYRLYVYYRHPNTSENRRCAKYGKANYIRLVLCQYAACQFIHLNKTGGAIWCTYSSTRQYGDLFVSGPVLTREPRLRVIACHLSPPIVACISMFTTAKPGTQERYGSSSSNIIRKPLVRHISRNKTVGVCYSLLLWWHQPVRLFQTDNVP